MYLDNHPIDEDKIMKILRKSAGVPKLIQEMLIDKELESIELTTERKEELVREYRKSLKIEKDDDYLNYLKENFLDETLLMEMVTRPERVIKYREERWGPRVQTLYLKNKEKFDIITFRKIESTDADIMQEVYFRLKDREVSWDEMAIIFDPRNERPNARVGPISVDQIERELLNALREEGIGKIIKPLSTNGKIIVAELELLEPGKFNEEIRQEIMRDEFNEWLKSTTIKTLKQIRFEK
jgi:hypothetical protein